MPFKRQAIRISFMAGFGACVAMHAAVAWAESAAEDALRAENQRLRARVEELEAQVASFKRTHPADVKRPEHPSMLEEAVEPILAPAKLVLTQAEQVSDGWWRHIREGVDRVDHFFYVDDAKAWMTTEYQFDTRGFHTINFTGASRLPIGFSLWGFVDFETADAPGNTDSDLNEFFMELDLKRELWKGFGAVAEYNDAQGRSDNVGRFGLYYAAPWAWLKQLDLTLFTKWFPLGTEPSRRQGSFAWNWAPRYILDGRFSTGGFWDLNFDEKEGRYRPQIVSDVQLRYRLIGNLNALLEYRYSEFFEKDKAAGWGLGFQYRF